MFTVNLPGVEDDRQLDAVLAHGLLNSLAVLSGAAASILAINDGHGDPAALDDLLALIDHQSELFVDGLQLLVRQASDAFADAATAVSLAAATASRGDSPTRRLCCETLVERSQLIGRTLQGVVRGLPSEVLDLLGGLPATPPGLVVQPSAE